MSEPSRIALDHAFNDPNLLRQALTHRSYGIPHNERLEFVGDAILNCVVALSLYERYPALPEGELSRVRAHLVNKETLAQVARRLDLGASIRLGEGELRSGGADRLRAADPAALGKDPKTRLQEWLQGQRLSVPEYAIVATTGEAHAQQFAVECRIAGLSIVAAGTGASRRAAEQEAAAKALSAALAKDPRARA